MYTCKRESGFCSKSPLQDKELALEMYNRHQKRAVELVHPDNLLLWGPEDGWQGLCGFLGVDMPNETFLTNMMIIC